MPIFTVGAGFAAQFRTIPLATADGDIVVADDHIIRIETAAGQGRPSGFENYIGDFTYNHQGLPLGKIDEYRFVTGAETLVYDIADANISVLQLRKTAELDDPQAFLKLIFRDDDRLTGQALDDQMRAFAGNDRLDGRAGDDSLRGMRGHDAIYGNAGNDRLYGGNGADLLRGGAGDDRLDGGPGRNILSGGNGDDTFVFRTSGKPSRIADFSEGDLIALGFPGLGPAGPLDASVFHRGVRAKDRDQKVLYDAETGWLLYAKKGSATHDPVAFARVGKGLDHIGAEDFVVV